jgi:hypothetical protein
MRRNLAGVEVEVGRQEQAGSYIAMAAWRVAHL